MKEFFVDHSNKIILTKFKNNLDFVRNSTEFERSRDEVIKTILNGMISKPDEWDRSCQVNIEWLAPHLIDRLSVNGSDFPKPFLDDVCVILFRFLNELYLSISQDLSREFEVARSFVVENASKFDETPRLQINYALHQMPISILKNIIGSDAISSMRDFNAIYSKAEKMKNDWNIEIEEKEVKVNILKESLSKYQNAFNFVGLYQGFDELSIKKSKERDQTLFWMKVFAGLILVPIIIEFIVIIFNIRDIESIKAALVISFFPALSMVTLMIYYFRILLANYKSVKAQLLQIELRKTLCRFIQHYSEYSLQVKKQDAESLAKFENIIFSGLVADDASLPSSYDGVEQLANFIKSIKS